MPRRPAGWRDGAPVPGGEDRRPFVHPLWRPAPVRCLTGDGSPPGSGFRPSRRRRAGEAGFTLLEMLVALAVVGAVLALVLYRGPQRPVALDLGAGTRRVASALRLARGRAIRTDRVVSFALAAAGTGFRLDGEAPEALPPGVVARVLPPGAGGVIRFAPDGSASGGRVLLAAGGRAAGVAVDWLTGRVRVGDGS